MEAILAGREQVEAMANDILDNGVDGMKDLLETAGNPNQYDRYDRDQYEAVAKILNEVLDNYSDSL